MRASLWSAKVRNAGDISTAVNDTSNVDRNTSNGRLHLLKADSSIPRRVGEDRVSGGAVHLRANPADIRVRLKLPNPEVSPGAEHRGAECRHIGGDAGGAHIRELGGGVPDRDGPAGGVAGTELVVVDRRGGPVRVHSEEREV